MRRMLATENIYRAYRSREAYRDKEGGVNWAEWAERNPGLAEILNRAAKVAAEADNDGDS